MFFSKKRFGFINNESLVSNVVFLAPDDAMYPTCGLFKFAFEVQSLNLSPKFSNEVIRTRIGIWSRAKRVWKGLNKSVPSVFCSLIKKRKGCDPTQLEKVALSTNLYFSSSYSQVTFSSSFVIIIFSFGKQSLNSYSSLIGCKVFRYCPSFLITYPFESNKARN